MKSNVIPVKFGHQHIGFPDHSKAIDRRREEAAMRATIVLKAVRNTLIVSTAFIVGIIIGTIISQGMVGL